MDLLHLDRRPGVLLGLPDHDDRHGLPDADAPPPADAPLAYVDMPGGGRPRRRGDLSPQQRRRPPPPVRRQRADRARPPRDLPARAPRRADLAAALLPAAAVDGGGDVEFRPSNRADIRFDGLLDISDAAFDAIRAGLLEKLERVFGAILGGRPEEEVYALWREITAADVAAAEARHARPGVVPPEPAGRRAARRAAARHRSPRAGRRRRRRALRGARRGDIHRTLPVLAASLAEHIERPLHLWVLGGAYGPARPAASRRDGQPRADRRAQSAICRCVLPELLPDVDRLVLLPAALPSPPRTSRSWPSSTSGPTGSRRRVVWGRLGVSGFGVIHGAAGRLGHRTDAAAELRRVAHGLHRFDFDAFTGRAARARPRAVAGDRPGRPGARARRRVRAQRARGPARPRWARTGRPCPSAGPSCRPARPSARPGSCTGPTASSRGSPSSRRSASAGAAWPRRARSRRQLREQALPAVGERLELVAGDLLGGRRSERPPAVLVGHQPVQHGAQRLRVPVRDDVAVDAVGDDVARARSGSRRPRRGARRPSPRAAPSGSPRGARSSRTAEALRQLVGHPRVWPRRRAQPRIPSSPISRSSASPLGPGAEDVQPPVRAVGRTSRPRFEQAVERLASRQPTRQRPRPSRRGMRAAPRPTGPGWDAHDATSLTHQLAILGSGAPP